MKGLKKVIIKSLSVMLAVVLTLTAAPLSGFVGFELPDWLDFSIKTKASTTSNGEAVSETEIINIDVYKAQCLAGIAQDSKSDAVEQCNDIYNYYINEELFSPTQTFLDAVYENESLVADYNEWMAYSLAAEPSSALDLVASKESYYESCVIAMYSEATVKNDAFIKLIENNALNSSVALIETMCELKGITETAQIIETVDITNPKTITDIQECVNATYSLSTAADVCSVVGTVLDYSTDIFDVMDRLAVYGEMVELDKSTKLWLSQMYDACDGAYDLSFKSALYDLKTASTDYAGAILVDIKTTGFTLAKWGISATIETGMEMFAAINPMTAAVCAGLKLGKTVNNLFFATDDVCEQLFVMNCIYDIQDLSRGVAEDCKNIFVAEQTSENAMAFTYSVDCYFESIINADVDCMLSLLDTLYNGGWLKGLLTWMYGATNDYQEAVNTMESLREVRQNNYDLMINCFKAALRVNFPDIFDYYFEVDNTVPITDISFYIGRILPSGYPAGYADLIVGDFANIGVQYEPSNTTQKAYTVTSDNPEVLEVNDNIAMAVSAGTANVTITSVENPRVSYSEEITVGEPLVEVDTDANTTRFRYIIENDKITITGLVSGYNPETLQIPEAISEYPVTKIDNFAFLNNKSIKNITIPSTVTEIGNYAFYKCSALAQITFSEGLEAIGDGAFDNCSVLKEAILPDTVSNLGISAFENCSSLLNVQLSSGITELKDRTFYNCDSLEEITVSQYVTKFGQGIFGGCDSLKKVFFGINKGTSSYKQIYRASDTLQNIKSITISDDVQIVDTCCFYGTELYSVTIPDSIKTIGGYVGDYSDLNHIFYEGTESSWSSLMNRANQYGSTQTLSRIKDAGHIHFEVSLQNNTTITNEIAPTCTENGSNNIYCNICNELLGSEIIPATGHVGKLIQKVLPTCTERGYSRYYCVVCDEEYITDYVDATHQHNYDENGSCYVCDQNIYFDYSISNEEVSITGYLSDKSTISVPNHIEFLPVKHIADNAFEDCTVIENIKISNSITSIGEKAFYGCTNITNIDIPDSINNIKEYAFANCSNIASITIPDSVNSIEAYTFSNCTSMINVDIPDSVVGIGYGAFTGCGNLTEMALPLCHIAPFGRIFGESEYAGGVPIEQRSNAYSTYYSTYYIPANLKTITLTGNQVVAAAFENCTNITNITLKNDITDIGTKAFYNCQNLSHITIGERVCSIGTDAFTNTAYYLDETNWENGILYLNNCLIQGKEHITEAEIQYGIFCISDSAFSDCYALENISISDSVAHIGSRVFENCSSLTQLIIPDSVLTLGVINDCEKLEYVNIGDGITEMPSFNECRKLKSVFVGSGVSSGLDRSAFSNSDYSLERIDVSEQNSYYSSLDGVVFNKDYSILILFPNYNSDEYIVPSTVTRIENEAFYFFARHGNLERVSLPEGLISIGDNAFRDCRVKTFSLPESLKSIGTYAFYGCDSYYFNSINIPENVEEIGERAFSGCDHLTEINVSAANKTYSSESGVLFNKDKTNLIQYPIGNTNRIYFVPETVKEILDYSFTGLQYLESIGFSSNLGKIGCNNFLNCSLQNVLYTLSEEDWSNIVIQPNNDNLSSANFHFDFNLNYSENIASTCQEKGYFKYVCSCGYTISGEHDFAKCNRQLIDVIAPTCDAEGYTLSKCTVCHAAIYSEWQNALGHNFNENECMRCGQLLHIINIGDVLTTSIETPGDISLFRFVPEVSGKYYFYSISTDDTYGYLYDDNMNLLSTDDDNGDYSNFSISYSFVAGETYYLGAKFLSSSKIGDFTIYLSTGYTPNLNGIASNQGVVVIPGSNDILPADTTLNVNLLEITNVSMTYDITLTSNGIETQPSGLIMVKLPVSEGVDGNLVSVYRCETDGTYTNMGAVYENGYMIFITDHFSKYMMTLEDPTTPDVPDEPEYNYTFSIQTPSRTEIRNKDGIILHANVEGNAPAGSYVRWESSNGNFDKSADGSNLKIIAKNKGYTTFTAILCDADGNELARDTVEMYSKSGFFDKIGGFFRSLFGTTKIYEN